MAWQNLLITQPAKLNLKNAQLRVRQESGEITVPLEDIATIILESAQITLTSSLLGAIAENKICLFSCNSAHTPNGAFIPFHQHSRQASASQKQIAWTKPFKKRCWQKIIRAKIQNQMDCIQHVKGTSSATIKRLIIRVDSGDTKNREAQAARIYYKSLWSQFKRHDNDIINTALNYGYAILRGALARSLVVYGLIPSLGINHKSELNAFNLADDLIEPFRPILDRLVCSTIQPEQDNSVLTTKQRVDLVKVLSLDCIVNKQIVSVFRACNLICSSLITATELKDALALQLPSLSEPISTHRYE